MKNVIVRQVAKAIKGRRCALGLSQEELAHRSGLDRTYISGVERGVRNITLHSLERILDALEWPADDFFGQLSKVPREADHD